MTRIARRGAIRFSALSRVCAECHDEVSKIAAGPCVDALAFPRVCLSRMVGYITSYSARLHAGLAVAICLLALGIEGATLGLEIQSLVRRQIAYSQGQAALGAYDASTLDCAAYYLPQSDVSSQPGGIGSTALWHIFNMIALGFIAASEAPTRIIMQAWLAWAGPFGAFSSTWYIGALEILIGSSLVATPPSIYGSLFSGFRLWAAGWPLIGIGASNILLSLLCGQSVRVARDQADSIKFLKPAHECEAVRQELLTAMKEVTVLRVPLQRLTFAMKNYADAIEELVYYEDEKNYSKFM